MTVREIAELAGVSIGTVDRVLHRRGRVAPKTAKKIEAIIDKHPFTPNPIARRLKRNRAYRFYALLPRRDQDAGYWGLAIQGILEAAEELASLGVETRIVEFDHLDAAGFGKIAQKVLRERPDGVIFAPIYPQISLPLTEKLQNLGIPYVFLDTDLPGTAPVCAIQTDSFKGGYLAGKLLRLFAGRITDQVVIIWAPLNYHISRRREGFLRYAEEHGFRSLVKSFPEQEGVMLPEAETLNFLRKQRNLQGIFVSYSAVRQVVEEMEDRRKGENLFTVGYDLVPENYRLLKEGRIDALISQRSLEQGRQTMFSLYRHIVLGWKIEARIEMPLDVYFKENLPDDYPFRPFRIKEPLAR
jgi:LacI family transcriptional regulator